MSKFYPYLWRVSGLAASFAGSIALARTLGPSKLGVSAFWLSLAQLAVLLCTANQDAVLIRQYNKADTTRLRAAFAADAQSWRALCSVVAALIYIVAVTAWGTIHVGLYSSFVLVGGVLLLAGTVNAPLWQFYAVDDPTAAARFTGLQQISAAAIAVVACCFTNTVGLDLLVNGSVCSIIAVLAFRSIVRTSPEMDRLSIARAIRYLPTLRSGREVCFAGVLNYGYTTINIPIAALLVSIADLGVLRSGMQFATATAALVNLAVSIEYPKLVRVGVRHEELVVEVRRLSLRLAPLAIVLIAGVSLIVPAVYIHLVGRSFRGGGYVCAGLIVAKILSFFGNIFGYALLAEHRDAENLRNLVLGTAISLTVWTTFMAMFGVSAAGWSAILTEVVLIALHARSLFGVDPRADVAPQALPIR